MNDMGRGAIAGLAGTLAMSAAMAASRASGLMGGEVPPRKITRRMAEPAGVVDHPRGPGFEAGWIAQHLAYGTAAGVAYALLDRRLGHPSPAVAGPAFGLGLWAISYAGWLPSTGLYPPPDRDRPGRVGNMIAHHLIYGTATGLVARALRDGTSSTGA